MTKLPKILVSLARFVPGQTLGAQTFLIELCRELTSSTKYDYVFSGSLETKGLLMRNGVDVQSWHLCEGFIGDWISAPAEARRAGCEAMLFPLNIKPPWASLPTVLFLHDLVQSHKSYFGFGSLNIRRRVKESLVRWSFLSADAICVPSGSIRDELCLKMSPIRPPIYVAPEGCSYRAVPVITKTPGLIFVPGCYAIHKNTELVIQSLALARRSFTENRFNQIQVIFTGCGSRQERYREMSRQFNLDGLCDFRQRISDDEIESLYRQAEICILPSMYEGFGLCVLEAMRTGCKVVHSKIGAHMEIAGDLGFAFDPTSVEACAAALASALMTDDPAHCQKVVERSERFSWAGCVASIEGAITEVLEKRGKSGYSGARGHQSAGVKGSMGP